MNFLHKPIIAAYPTSVAERLRVNSVFVSSDALYFPAASFGLYPFAGPHQILHDDSYLSRHSKKVKEDLIQTLRNSEYNGYIFVNYSQHWHPSFDYSEYSKKYGLFYENDFNPLGLSQSNIFNTKDKNYREDFYNYFKIFKTEDISGLSSNSQIDSYIKNQWNSISRQFYETTIKSIRDVFPLAKIGFVDLPSSLYRNNFLTDLPPAEMGYGKKFSDEWGVIFNTAQEINNDMSWLWNQVDIISPFIRSVRHTVLDSKTPMTGIENSNFINKEYIKSNVLESLRISKEFKKRSIPVFEHFYSVISQYTKKPLNDINWNQILSIPYETGVDSIALVYDLNISDEKSLQKDHLESIPNILRTKTFKKNFQGNRFLPIGGSSVSSISSATNREFIDNSQNTNSQEPYEPYDPYLPNTGDDPFNVFYSTIQGKSSDPVNGFGLVRYNPPISETISDADDDPLLNYQVTAIVNSVNGQVEFAEPLSKKDSLAINIFNCSLTNTGLPHYVLEDTFEWLNSGMPSHLSQVKQSNVLQMGLNMRKTNNAAMEKAPAYQAKYTLPCDVNFYDRFNSTVDFKIQSSNSNQNYSLPFINSVCKVVNPDNSVDIWVAGLGGAAKIDADSFNVSRIDLDSVNANIEIKDIKQFDDKIYLLDSRFLYIYDLVSGDVSRDPAINVPSDRYVINKFGNGNFVISARDGIYVKRSIDDEWTRVLEVSSPISKIIIPDAGFAFGDNIYYSLNGIDWTDIGRYSRVSDAKKIRSSIFLSQESGLFSDGGNLYSQNASFTKVDLLVSDPEDLPVGFINSFVYDTDGGITYIAYSDGNYISLGPTSSSVIKSQFDTIHHILYHDSKIWLFSFNEFAVEGHIDPSRIVSGIKI